MDYQELCVEIFGTDDEERLKEIAGKAKKLDQIYAGETVVNRRGAGRKPKIRDEDIEEMQRRYAAGAGIGQIAKEFHVTRPTVYKYISSKRRWEEDHFVRMRMDVMYKDQVCSIVDVDFKNRKVYVENKTDKVVLRAFGVNCHPDWDDFQYFLESRCFPKTRCQSKEILKENGLDFYDPLQIIEKTEGRMAEDHQWIRIHYKGEDGGWRR